MATFRKFTEIEAWKLSRQLVRDVYDMTRSGGFVNDRGFREQIQRASVSIGSNIAEGFARRGNKEFTKFLWIAKGSAAEVQSQLITALDIKYIDSALCKKLYNDLDVISVKLYSLIEVLSKDIDRIRKV